MPEIYVIRPTERAADLRGLPTAQEIVDQGQAQGFLGKLTRVQACARIVITDGNGFSRIADIQTVQQHLPPNVEAQHGRSRVDITFHHAREIQGALLQHIAAIRWSQSNVRYLDI